MPSMSPWPRNKVIRSLPFQYTGLDYFGPLYIKRGNHVDRRKVQVCLFTCVALRAIHLEIVADLSAEEFLLALRHFYARRGKPQQIVLDNAPQFKLTKSSVDVAWENTYVQWIQMSNQVLLNKESNGCLQSNYLHGQEDFMRDYQESAKWHYEKQSEKHASQCYNSKPL